VVKWLTEPVPRGRVAAFRTLVYLFVAADLVWFTPWVRAHADVPGELYRPLFVGRLLHLPTPDHPLVTGIFWALFVLALAAATGRAPRALGIAVFVLYFEWMIIAMSYGKVDHDRFALLVALAVLPTAGRARHGDRTATERGGWALRVTQIAVVATYFLAAWAKLRFGGPGWMFGSVLMRAIIRRGTALTDMLSSAPGVLIAAQIGIIAFELASPLIFVLPQRWRYAAVAYFYSFHVLTIAMITISFAPHLVAITSFLPLEKVRPVAWLARGLHRGRRRSVGPAEPRLEASPLGGGEDTGGRAAGHPVPVPGDPAVHGPGNGQHGAKVEQPAEPAPGTA